MIYIDTNILYYASRVAGDNPIYSSKLDDYIESKKGEIYISSVSVYEYICKYHNDSKKLKIIEQYIEEKKIRIINDQYYSLPSSYYKRDNYENIYKECIENRIPIESKVINEVIKALYYISLKAMFKVNGIDINDEIEKIILKIVPIYEAVNYFWIPLFLEECYNNEGKDYAWKRINTLLLTLIENTFPAMNIVLLVVLGEIKPDLNIYLKKYSKEKINKKGNSGGFLHAIINQIKRGDRIDFLQKEYQMLSNEDIISKERLCYIVSKTLESGNIIDKNDITDALIIRNIRSKEDILISIDKDILKYMELQNKDNLFTESIQVIKKLKNYD